MENTMRVIIDVIWDCGGPTKSGTVRVDGYRMDFVVHNGQLILSDPDASEICIRSVAEALKGLGVNVFKTEKA